MAIVLVDHAGAASSDQFNATTAAVDDTGADLDIIAVGYGNVTTNIGVSDSKSNSYTNLAASTASNSGDINVQLFYRTSPTVGSGHTATAAAVIFKPFPCICFAAFSGVNFYDATAQNHDDGAVTSLQSGSITPSLGGSLLFTTIALRGFSPGQTFSIDSGFTILRQFPGDGATHVPAAFAYKIQGAAAAINPTWSWNNGGDTPAATISAFAPVSGGGGGGGNPWYYYAQQRVKTELSRVWNRRGPLWVPDYVMRTKVA